MSNNRVVDLDAVMMAERAAIDERRKRVGLAQSPRPTASIAGANGIETDHGVPSDPPTSDFFGVAFSGGGIRAACVSLGLVQAFQRHGIMRFVDYLSTVSGGGYLGSHLSSSVLPGATPAANGHAPDRDNLYPSLWLPQQKHPSTQPGQLNRALRFIYGGKYLYKPWQFANRYFIGLFFNALPIVSALIVVCSLIALLWRALDLRWFRDFAELYRLNYDTTMAYLPFVALTCLWAAAWLISYCTRGAEAPGRVAQILLYMTVASFLIGSAMLLGNGSSTLDLLTRTLVGRWAPSATTTTYVVLSAIVAGLLPFLNPRKLLQRGLHPRSRLDRLIFVASCTALLVGVPLIGVAVFAKRNISLTASSPDSSLRSAEIYDWPAFCSLIGTEDKSVRAQEPGGGVARDDDSNELANLAAQCLQVLKEREELQSQKEDWYQNWAISNVSRLSTALNIWDAHQRLRADQDTVCKLFNDSLLSSPRIAMVLADKEYTPLIEGMSNKWAQVKFADEYKSLTTAITNVAKDSEEDPADLLTLVEQAKLANVLKNPKVWTTNEWREFNRELLFALHPSCFHAPQSNLRELVTDFDQWARLWWLLGSIGVFLVTAIGIDLNATSLHRFYRNRLAYAFVEPQIRPNKPENTPNKPGLGPEVLLSELNTTAVGAPYHLINASLNRFDSRFGKLLERLDDEAEKSEPDRRSTRHFLFSHKFCGSELTGFAATADYEGTPPRHLSLADAVALSGAAVNPVQFDFPPLAWMMTALNLRLGQWLPNPRYTSADGKQRRRASILALLPGCLRKVEERKFCFVSDGGFNENLGIAPLLKRRCKLIVALDVSCDPKHQFADLTRVIRYARIKEGIAITNCSVDHTTARESECPLSTNDLQIDKDGLCRQHFLVGDIHYPAVVRSDGSQLEPEIGLLIYIKPSFTGDESADLLQYRGEDDAFPHDSTTDQLYNEVRVESYRQIGFHIGEEVCKNLFGQVGDESGIHIELIRSAFETVQRKANERAAAKDLLAYSVQRLANVAQGAEENGSRDGGSVTSRALRVELQRAPLQAASQVKVGEQIAEALRSLAAASEGLYEKHFHHDTFAPEVEQQWVQDRQDVAKTFDELAAAARDIAATFDKSPNQSLRLVSAAINDLADRWLNVAKELNVS